MLKKVFLSSLFSAVLITSAGASETLKSNNQFIDLMECMKNAPFDKTSIKGANLQQVVLISVLENLTNQKAPSIEELDVDYSNVHQLVEKHCPKELDELKQLIVKAN